MLNRKFNYYIYFLNFHLLNDTLLELYSCHTKRGSKILMKLSYFQRELTVTTLLEHVHIPIIVRLNPWKLGKRILLLYMYACMSIENL